MLPLEACTLVGLKIFVSLKVQCTPYVKYSALAVQGAHPLHIHKRTRTRSGQTDRETYRTVRPTESDKDRPGKCVFHKRKCEGLREQITGSVAWMEIKYCVNPSALFYNRSR